MKNSGLMFLFFGHFSVKEMLGLHKRESYCYQKSAYKLYLTVDLAAKTLTKRSKDHLGGAPVA